MAVGTGTAIVISSVMAAAAAAHQADRTRQASYDAKTQSDNALNAQDELMKAEKDRVTNEESMSTADALRNQSRSRQRALGTGGQSRRDTILTSPLGVTGADAGSSKTLLGQ